MTIKSSIDFDKGIAIHRAEGEITAEEILESARAQYVDKDYRPDTNILWDFTRIEGPSFTFDDVRQVAQYLGTHMQIRGSGRLAIAVRRPEAWVNAKLFEHTTKGLPIKIKIFGDLEQALSWLAGRDDPTG